MCVEGTRDFGDVVQGDEIFATFTVRNTSRSNATITHVEEHCDCASVVIPTRTLSPQGAETVKVTWKTEGKRGKVNSYITLDYRLQNAPTTECLRLQICANVIPDFDYEPSGLSFTQGIEAARSISFTPRLLEVVTIRRAYSTHRAFEVQVSDDLLRIDVFFNPALWTADTRADLMVETNSVKAPRVRIPLTAE